MNDHADTLRRIRDLIAAAPINCLGTDRDGNMEWPLRDEVVDGLSKTIAALEAGRSSDWVLVPREPTDGMMEAANRAVNDSTYEVYPEEVRAAWNAMLAAAPQQPPVGVTDAMLAEALGIPKGVAALIVAVEDADRHETRGRWLSHLPTAAAKINAALSQQEAAPSVSEAGTNPSVHGSCEDPRLSAAGYFVCGSNADREWHYRRPDGSWRDRFATEEAAVDAALAELAAPVSEPAASERTRMDDMIEHGMSGIDWTPPAASGEGLPELPPSFARACADGYWVLRKKGTEQFDAHDSRYTPAQEVYSADQMRACAIEARRLATTGQAPIPMLLFCPKCNVQHVDAPDERTPNWDNPPHRSHLCHACGHVWRPADVATTGVAKLTTAGSRDGSPVPATTGQGDVEWRWVDEKGRAMTEWKAGNPPPMAAVTDEKGVMRVEVRPFGQQQEGQG